MTVYLLLGNDEERKARGVERLRRGRPVEAHLLDIVAKRSAQKLLWQVGSPRLVLRSGRVCAADARVLGGCACTSIATVDFTEPARASTTG